MSLRRFVIASTLGLTGLALAGMSVFAQDACPASVKLDPGQELVIETQGEGDLLHLRGRIDLIRFGTADGRRRSAVRYLASGSMIEAESEHPLFPTVVLLHQPPPAGIEGEPRRVTYRYGRPTYELLADLARGSVTVRVAVTSTTGTVEHTLSARRTGADRLSIGPCVYDTERFEVMVFQDDGGAERVVRHYIPTVDMLVTTETTTEGPTRGARTARTTPLKIHVRTGG